MQIWKYHLELGEQVIEMPIGAKVLEVHEQGGSICLWAEVNAKRDLQARRFLVVGTGVELPDSAAANHYLGTIHFEGLVWHVYGDQPRHRG